MCKDQFEKCPVTGEMKGWCRLGAEAERDAARIERFRKMQLLAQAQKAQSHTDYDQKLTDRARRRALLGS